MSVKPSPKTNAFGHRVLCCNVEVCKGKSLTNNLAQQCATMMITHDDYHND